MNLHDDILLNDDNLDAILKKDPGRLLSSFVWVPTLNASYGSLVFDEVMLPEYRLVFTRIMVEIYNKIVQEVRNETL